MLEPALRAKLTLPAVCAPMMLVSGPELVAEACRNGLMAGLPTHNARDLAEFERWLIQIRDARAADGREEAGLLAVNLSGRRTGDEIEAHLTLCAQYRVQIIISAMGHPADLVRRAHDRGLRVYHDVVTIAYAEKAIAAGVDGLICIASGGGGHSGTINPLVFIPKVRAMFGGVIIMAGGASTGAAIRAAEVLGADLCYLGTRFIATKEARAPEAYKAMIVAADADDVLFSSRISGVGANWLAPSLRAHGLNPADLPEASAPRDYSHLPEGVRPWRDLWSAGQGAALIEDVPSVAALISRLRAEYAAACATPVTGCAHE